MNNKDLQRVLAKKLGITQAEAGEHVEALVRCIERRMVAGDGVSVARLGTLEPRKKAARSAKMPHAKECITIPERKDVTLRVTSTFKNHLKQLKHE